MQTEPQPTGDSAVELDEAALEGVQGGGAINQANTAMQKVAPAMIKHMPTAGAPGKITNGIEFVAPGDVAG